MQPESGFSEGGGGTSTSGNANISLNTQSRAHTHRKYFHFDAANLGLIVTVPQGLVGSGGGLNRLPLRS